MVGRELVHTGAISSRMEVHDRLLAFERCALAAIRLLTSEANDARKVGPRLWRRPRGLALPWR